MTIIEQCRNFTNLQDTQIQLLEKICAYLPFAASVSLQEVVLFVVGHDDRIRILAHEGGAEASRRNFLPGTHKDKCELPLWNEVFNVGKPLWGRQEQSLGEFAKLGLFPIVDRGGKVIGGLAFMDNQNKKESSLLAEMAYMSIMVPDSSIDGLYDCVSYSDGLLLFDESGTILYANEAASRLVNLFGFDRRLVGTSIFKGSLKLSLVKRVLANYKGALEEELYDGLVISQAIIPIISGGKIKGAYLVLRDKTYQRKAEQELLVKNSVIKEIHHRVKNNLQSVSGLLRMQARRSESEEVAKALMESIHRIESMSLVHEILCHYDEEYVEISKISDELIRLLSASLLNSSHHIEAYYEGESILLTSDQASYVALIINELITNAIEHGFKDIHKGKITVEGYLLASNRVSLSVSDTGQGIEDAAALLQTKRLGMQIIKNLVENQLEGTIGIGQNNPHGTIITIEFERAE